MKGEQNREIIDFHFLRSLSLSFSLFVSRFPRSPFSLARQRRSPFNSVLPSFSSSQNDSTSSVLNRSCARERLSSRVYTCCPSFAIRVCSSPGYPREICETSLRSTCDAIACRVDWGRVRAFFSLYFSPCYSRACLAALTRVKCALCYYDTRKRDTICRYYRAKRRKRRANVLNLWVAISVISERDNKMAIRDCDTLLQKSIINTYYYLS